jgi:hypothetical protein
MVDEFSKGIILYCLMENIVVLFDGEYCCIVRWRILLYCLMENIVVLFDGEYCCIVRMNFLKELYFIICWRTNYIIIEYSLSL